MEYPISFVVNAILEQSAKARFCVHQHEMHDMLFAIQSLMLGRYARTLFEEKPQAWPQGPSYASIYHRLKNYGKYPIEKYLVEFSPESQGFEALVPSHEDEQAWSVIRNVVDHWPSQKSKWSTWARSSDNAWYTSHMRRDLWVDHAQMQANACALVSATNKPSPT